METFTLSVQDVSNVHEWFRISSGLKITFPMVLTFHHISYGFVIWTLLVVWGLSARIYTI